MSSSEPNYGPEAQTDRDFESLTRKQRNTVEAIIAADPGATNIAIAEDAGISDSYVEYVRENFPHILDERRGAMSVVADGGNPTYEVELSGDDVWKAIRLLPDDLSTKIFRQVRADEAPASR